MGNVNFNDNKKNSLLELRVKLENLKKDLPKGSIFVFVIYPSHLHISNFSIPLRLRRCGYGTEFFKKILDITDELEFFVGLHAHPTETSHALKLDDLVLWYEKMGFHFISQEAEGPYLHRSFKKTKNLKYN